MIQIGDRKITMRRGWIVQYKDGTVCCEDDMPWIKLPNKRALARVILKWENKTWSLDNKENYTPPKTRAFIDVNSGGVSQGIHSRSIGYYDMEEKCRVYLRVNEINGQMNYETEPF